MNLLTDRIAVITGGTSGIGEAAVELFAKRGAKVLFTGRNADAGKKIMTRLSAGEADIDFFQCDITGLQDIDRLRTYCETKYGKIDILINNAGMMTESGEIDKILVEDWEKTFDVNITGVFKTIRALKDLVIRCQGCIINNASIAGMHSYVTGKTYAYSASKAALIQFTRQLAKNYACYGVRINCICPGIIDTPILGDRDRNEYAKRIPLGYVGKPEEIANVVAFLASKDANYITGCVLPVDGGVSLG